MGCQVYPSVYLHDSAQDSVDGLGGYLVWVLSHWGLHKNYTFAQPMINDKMTGEEICEVDSE